MWSNLIVATSNLMALRVIRYLYAKEKMWAFCVLFGSMMSSICFHLVETDEVASSSPVDRAILSGIFNKKVSYGGVLLLFDRIFAILAALSGLAFIRETGQLHKAQNTNTNEPKLNWKKLIVYAGISLGVTIYSELSSNEAMYVVSHSLWHIMVYHIAYCVFNPENSSLYDS